MDMDDILEALFVAAVEESPAYKGMLQHRRFHIVLVNANSGAGDQPMQASKSVEYDGKAVKIQL